MIIVIGVAVFVVLAILILLYQCSITHIESLVIDEQVYYARGIKRTPSKTSKKFDVLEFYIYKDGETIVYFCTEVPRGCYDFELCFNGDENEINDPYSWFLVGDEVYVLGEDDEPDDDEPE